MDHDVFHRARIVAQRRVHDPLERDVLALAVGQVRGDDHLRPTGPDPIAQRARAKTGEHHGVDGPDAQDRKHRRDGLDGRRHVDGHPVSPPHPEPAQRRGDRPNLVEQLLVRQPTTASSFVGGDERDLAAAAQGHLVVQRGPAHVRPPADEPAERRGLVDEDPIRRPEPWDELVGDLAPERLGVGERGRPQSIERMLSRHVATVPDGDQRARAVGYTRAR